MSQVSFLELVEAGRSGDRLISFPTDTVPALAVRPDCAKQIYAAKQRSETKPLILMAATAEDLWRYVAGSEAERAIWAEVAATYWPGALTLVLPASDRLPPEVNPMNPTTIGIRVPDRAIARQVLLKTGALATTSVNRSGAPPLLTIEAINTEFPEVFTLSPDELRTLEPEQRSDLQSGVPSTVAKWEHGRWEIVRQGVVELV